MSSSSKKKKKKLGSIHPSIYPSIHDHRDFQDREEHQNNTLSCDSTHIPVMTATRSRSEPLNLAGWMKG